MKTPSSQRPNIVKITIIFFVAFFSAINSYATDVSFQWKANPDVITGYKLYYKQGASSAPPYTGTGLNQGNAPILLGPGITTYTVTGLDPNKSYHFVLSAYNKDGESGFSKIVTVNPTPTIYNISTN